MACVAALLLGVSVALEPLKKSLSSWLMPSFTRSQEIGTQAWNVCSEQSLQNMCNAST